MTATTITHQQKSAEQQTSIEISLGNKCNYACSYCPDSLHNGSTGWHTVEQVQNFITACNDHYGPDRTLMIQYTGGEPTMAPGFEQMLKFGADLGVVHSIISNGSRTLKWWTRMAPYMHKVHLTFHQEFADIDHFRKVVRVLESEMTHPIRIHINFTMIPDLFEEIRQVANTMRGHDNTTITLKPLRINFGNELYPYTDDQIEFMRTFTMSNTLRKSYDQRGNMVVSHDDGTTVVKKPSQFLLDGDNQWQGWDCWIGQQSLVVNPDGSIYRGICRVGGNLGNIRDTYVLPTGTIVCDKQVCACPTDIMTRKEKI